MHHYKLIYFCQRCRKEHDHTHEPMLETGVKCDCGGYVITPSGRATMQIKLTADVFVIRGEKFIGWVGAESELEARILFHERLEENEIVELAKLTNQEVIETKFAFNPKNSINPDDFIWATAKELLTTNEELPVLIYAIDLETFAEAQKRKQRGEL